MAWQTPKTNWNAADGVRNTDLNRIEENILHLRSTESLKEARSVYVSPNGNDATGTGTSSAPFKTINKALSVIPKNLGGYDVRVYLAAGTYDEKVLVNHFGNGRLLFAGLNDTAVNVTITGIDVLNTHYCQFVNTVNLTIGADALVVNNNSLVIITGSLVVNGGQYGISVSNNANLSCSGDTTVNGAQAAVRVSNGACTLNIINGTGNTTGLYCMAGGKITFTNAGALEAVTKYHAATGGRIYSGAQTSIPNY